MRIRQLSFSDKTALFFSELTAFIGVIFFLFSLFFLAIFSPVSDFSDIRFFPGRSTEKVTGTIKDVRSSSGTINGQRVMIYTYAFTVQEEVYERDFYSEKSHFGLNKEVSVEYLSSNPKVARVAGTRNAPFPGFIIFLILTFTTLGATMIFFSLKGTIKKSAILLNGAVSHGKLISKQRTLGNINKRPIYKLTFEFEVNGKTYTNTTRTISSRQLEDEEKEKLIYDRSDPSQSVMMDRLPNRFKTWY